MLDETVALRLPKELHHRVAAAAAATRRSLEEILLHALRIGSPPARDEAPPEHQAELAALAVHDGARTVDEAVDAVYQWNDRKRAFEPRQIQLVWDVLGEGGWLRAEHAAARRSRRSAHPFGVGLQRQ